MKLKKLLEKLDYTVINGSDETEVKNLVYDSRKAGQDDVFVCITGAVADGHGYIPDVVKKGVKAVIVEKDIDIIPDYKDVTFIKTKDNRLALA